MIDINYIILIPGLIIFSYKSICFYMFDYSTALNKYSSAIKILNEPFINEFRMLRIYTMILIINSYMLYNIYNEYIKLPENYVIEKYNKCDKTREFWSVIFNNFIWVSINLDMKYVREGLGG